MLTKTLINALQDTQSTIKKAIDSAKDKKDSLTTAGKPGTRETSRNSGKPESLKSNFLLRF